MSQEFRNMHVNIQILWKIINHCHEYYVERIGIDVSSLSWQTVSPHDENHLFSEGMFYD